MTVNKYLTNLNRIEFVITNGCTGHCKHCSQGDHTFRRRTIDGNIGAKVINDLCENYKITSLMTFGGEPLLYPDVVCKIHAAAKECNIINRELITNGYFSKNKNKISEVATALAQSGINKILLSIDAFHQETIPIEPVEFFSDCIIRENISIEVHPAWLVSENDNNKYNMKTRELLKLFTKKGISISSGNVIIPSGNAKKYFGEYFDESTEYISPYEQDPKNITAITISPNGDILNGNINQNCITDILNSYNANA